MANCPHCSVKYAGMPMKKMGKNWYCPSCGQEFKKNVSGKWVKV